MFYKKENTKDLRNWKVLPCSCVDRFNIVKIAILPKENYTSNGISRKLPRTFFTEKKKEHSNV